MKSIESLLSSITVVAFVATVIFYEFEVEPTQYDCAKLHVYNNVPDEVITECMNIINKRKHHIST